MPSYSYPSSGRLKMPEAYAGMTGFTTIKDGFVKEYANGEGGRHSTATIETTLDAGASAGDRAYIFVTPVGMAPFRVEFTVPDPVPAGAALQTAVLQALQDDTRVYGLGTWTSNATQVSFRSLVPGQQLSIYSRIDAAVGTMAIAVTNGTESGSYIAPGLPVVTDSTVDHPTTLIDDSSPAEVAFHPTQDLNLPASTQRWAGVTIEDEEENPPVTYGFPGFSSENSAFQRSQPQLTVKKHGHVWVALETPFTGRTFPDLLYRFAADGDKLHGFSFEAGTGLIEVPVGYSVVKTTHDGMTALVDFAKV